MARVGPHRRRERCSSSGSSRIDTYLLTRPRIRILMPTRCRPDIWLVGGTRVIKRTHSPLPKRYPSRGQPATSLTHTHGCARFGWLTKRPGVCRLATVVLVRACRALSIWLASTSLPITEHAHKIATRGTETSLPHTRTHHRIGALIGERARARSCQQPNERIRLAGASFVSRPVFEFACRLRQASAKGDANTDAGEESSVCAPSANYSRALPASRANASDWFAPGAGSN